MTERQAAHGQLIGTGMIELTGHDCEWQEETLVTNDLPHPRATYDDLPHILARGGHARRG